MNHLGRGQKTSTVEADPTCRSLENQLGRLLLVVFMDVDEGTDRAS